MKEIGGQVVSSAFIRGSPGACFIALGLRRFLRQHTGTGPNQGGRRADADRRARGPARGAHRFLSQILGRMCAASARQSGGGTR